MLDLYHLYNSLGFLYFFLIFFFIFISKINDWLDFKLYLKHERKFLTHSPLSPLLILMSVLFGSIFSTVNIMFGIYLGFIVYIIFLAHFFLDALNPSGVPLFPKTRISLKLFPYDDFKWNFFFLSIGILMISIAVLGFIVST